MFFRCNLHRDGDHALQRGQRSIVVRAGADDTYLCKYDDDAHARWVPGRWLEPEPGTFSRGSKEIMERPRGLYSFGPLVSDLRFPEPHMAAFGRRNIAKNLRKVDLASVSMMASTLETKLVQHVAQVRPP